VRAKNIKDRLAGGLEPWAADEAKALYTDIATVGALLEPFAAELMKNWLEGAPKDPYTIPSEHVKGAMLDEKGKKGPKEQLKAEICSWPSNPINGLGTVAGKTFKLTAKEGVYYHAFGDFRITFDGECDCRMGNCKFDGTWKFKDTYNWHPGLKAKVGGTELPDDWALLVEKYHGAKPFKEEGQYVGVVEMRCACEKQEEQENGRGEREGER